MIEPPRRILFATDFSGRCDRPLERSLRLARRWRSSLILLHVLEPPSSDLTDGECRAEEARIEKKLRSEALGAEVEIRTMIAKGPIPATIARVAEETDADLIVTGVARYNGFGDFILGTNVDRLVRRTDVPVLTVKERATSDYRNLLVATDFSNCSAMALEAAAGFFPDAALNLAHAYQVPLEPILGREAHAPALQAEIARELDDFLNNVHVSTEVRERIDIHVDYGEIRQVIGGLVESMEIDLAAIGTHGKSGFVAATIGSDAKKLLESLACDVLLVPDDIP